MRLASKSLLFAAALGLVQCTTDLGTLLNTHEDGGAGATDPIKPAPTADPEPDDVEPVTDGEPAPSGTDADAGGAVNPANPTSPTSAPTDGPGSEPSAGQGGSGGNPSPSGTGVGQDAGSSEDTDPNGDSLPGDVDAGDVETGSGGAPPDDSGATGGGSGVGQSPGTAGAEGSGASAGAGGAAGQGGSGGQEPEPFDLVSSAPSSAASDVAPDTDLELVFNREITVLTGELSVVRASDDSVFETVALTGSNVQVSGASLSIDLDGILAGSSSYYVVLDADAITATDDGTEFAGLTKASDVSFTTASVTTPGNVSTGLTLWFDADCEGCVKLDGDQVEVWADRSGNNYSLYPRNDDRRPDYLAAAIEGRAALAFAGNSIVGGATPEPFAQYDIFVVWRAAALPETTPTHLLRFGENLEVTYGHDNPAYQNSAASNFGASWTNVRFATPVVNTATLWNASFNTGSDSMTSYTNGTQNNNVTGVTQTPVASTVAFSIGGAWDMQRFFRGDIAEVVIYDRALNTTDRSAVTNYLRDKWGI